MSVDRHTDQAMLIVDPELFKLLLVCAADQSMTNSRKELDIRLVDLLEDILEPPVVLLQDGADGFQRIIQRSMSNMGTLTSL